MSSLNSVTLVGNMGADPELKATNSGRMVCNLRVATSESFKGADGTRKERTEWHTVVVFGDQAENCAKYLTRGRSVCVVGRIQTREYTAKDGGQRRVTEVVADRVVFLGGGGKAGGGDGGTAGLASGTTGQAPPSGGDDIPF